MGREAGWQGQPLCWAGASGHPGTYPVTPGLGGVGSEPHLRVQLLIPSPGERAKEPLRETGPETCGQPAHLARPDASLGGSASSTAGRITDAPSTTSSPGARGSGTHARSPYRTGDKRTHLSGVFQGWAGEGEEEVQSSTCCWINCAISPGYLQGQCLCLSVIITFFATLWHLLGSGTSL